MGKKTKTGIVITSAILMTFALISIHRSAKSPAPLTSLNLPKASIDKRKTSTLYPQIDGFEGQKHISFQERSGRTMVQENIHGEVSALINELTDPELSEVERNHIEHMLGSKKDKNIDKKIRIMLEDGLLDLSDQNRTVTARLMSAIRIAGLRSDAKSVSDIIKICSLPQINEDVRTAGYEALGYIGTETATEYLRNELSLGQEGFLQSQLVLSLGTAGDRKSSQQFLSYLNYPDPDLRDSAIIALGKIKEVRAVPKFKELYKKTTEPSKVLIVQALRDIGSSDAFEVLNKIFKEAIN